MAEENQLGLVQVFTGNGKGKTTSSLGLCLRAIGQGFNVYVIQFLKSGDTGELFSVRKYLPNMTIVQFGRQALMEKQTRVFEFSGKGDIKAVGPKAGKYFYFPPDADEAEPCRRALEHAFTVINSGEYNIVVLDEINCALAKNLIDINEVIRLIDNKPKNVELILTGRNVPKEIIEKADLVSEIREIKHPWHKGVLARRGIEY